MQISEIGSLLYCFCRVILSLYMGILPRELLESNLHYIYIYITYVSYVLYIKPEDIINGKFMVYQTESPMLQKINYFTSSSLVHKLNQPAFGVHILADAIARDLSVNGITKLCFSERA